MNSTLRKVITKEQLEKAARAMAKNRAPGLDGIGIEFFTEFWPIIGMDQIRM